MMNLPDRSSPPTPLRPWAKGIHLLLSLGLALSVAVVCLIPLHAAQTVALDMTFLQGERFFNIAKPEDFDLRPGDELPLYRYSEQLKVELGRARVLEVSPKKLRCEVITESFLLPVGRHGTVQIRDRKRFLLQLGKDHHLDMGAIMSVFEKQELIAQVRVPLPFQSGGPSMGVLHRVKQRGDDLFYMDSALSAGLGVSEFPVVTTVLMYSRAPWLAPFEIGVLLLVAALDLHLFFRRGMGFVAFLGSTGRRQVKAHPQAFALAFSGILLWLFSRYAGQVIHDLDLNSTVPPWTAWAVAGSLYAGQLALLRKRPSNLLGLTLAAPLYSFFGTFLSQLMTSPPLLRWLSAVQLPAWVPGGAGIEAFLDGAPAFQLPAWSWWAMATALYLLHLGMVLAGGQHLPIRLWNACRYRPRGLERRIVWDFRVQRTLVWLLNLVVLWVFVGVLVSLLTSNVNQALDYLAPNSVALTFSPVTLGSPASLISWVKDTSHNIALIRQSGAAALTVDQVLAVLRFVFQAVALLGGLWGYVHSLVWVFHYTKIRNIDFTPLGWIANSLCYPALLGALFWLSVPYPYGQVPNVANGPLFYALQGLDLLFNVLYAASMWSMGKRFGVMVDKGLVDTGFFEVVRHPIYTLEALVLFFGAARSLTSPGVWVGATLFLVLYWFRSERDDVFMTASNPDYLAYRERVPYKFLRGFW